MRRLFAVLALTFLAACATPSPIAIGDLLQQPATREAARSAVHKLLDGGSNACSAVAISPGLALTAAHCDMGAGMYLETPAGQVAVTKFTPDSKGRDIAVLVVPELKCPCAPLAIDHGVKMVRDDLTLVAGYPYGGIMVVSRGEFQGHYTYNGQKYLVSNNPVAPGNSGGGLFVVTPKGVYLVGIVSQMGRVGAVTLSVEIK